MQSRNLLTGNYKINKFHLHSLFHEVLKFILQKKLVLLCSGLRGQYQCQCVKISEKYILNVLWKKKRWNITFTTHYDLLYTQKCVMLLYFFALSYLRE